MKKISKPRHRPSKEQISRTAEKIQRVIVGTLLRKLRQLDLKAGEFETFFRGLLAESDTALAIVSYSYIDDRLRGLFSEVVNPEIRGGAETLLGPMGPLGTSSSRIQMAAALYWINKTTYLNLHSIRKVRNDFAHKPSSRTFTEKQISSLISSMVPVEEALLQAANLDGKVSLTNRQRFFLRTMLTCQRMIVEVACAPHAIRMGLSPFSALEVEWRRVPEPIREMQRASVRLLYACVNLNGN